jgi:hypothetical protein
MFIRVSFLCETQDVVLGWDHHTQTEGRMLLDFVDSRRKSEKKEEPCGEEEFFAAGS